MNLDELLIQLRKRFTGWFDDYAFQFVYYQTGRNDDFQIGLTSSFCRLSIEQEDGIFTIMIGLPTSVFGESDLVDGMKQWLSLEQVADFIEQRPFEWSRNSRNRDISEELNYLEQKIYPSWPKILPMFRNVTTMKVWYQQFWEYGTEQLRLRRRDHSHDHKK